MILSIHQPRSDVFALFSRLVLLSKGQAVYSGHQSHCLPWFASLDMVPPPGLNVLDWMIDVSTVDLRTTEAEEESRARVRRLVEAWRNTDGSRREKAAEETTAEHAKAEEPTAPALLWNDGGSKRPGMLGQTRILTHRCVSFEDSSREYNGI